MHDNVDGFSSMENLSMAIDKHSSTARKPHPEVNGLSTDIKSLSATVRMLCSTFKSMSSAIESLSAKVVTTSLAVDNLNARTDQIANTTGNKLAETVDGVDSLNAKTDQISNTIGNLTETVGEIVKRERVAMERFGNFPSQVGGPRFALQHF